MTALTPEKDLYDVLDVSPVATQEEIKSAYRKLARRYHPDSGDETASVERFQELQAAYEIVGDPIRRKAYDRQRAERYARAQSAFTWELVSSRDELPIITEEQMLYLLLDILPADGASGQRLPINLVLVIDRSTSMKGHRLDYVKAAAHRIVDELGEDDTLGIVTFSDRAEVAVPSQKVVSPARIHSHITAIWPSGGTEILQGLQAGLKQIRRYHSRNTLSHLLLLTDGQTYGDEEECIIESRGAALERISISTLGIGEDWNDSLLEEMARLARGNCFYISHPRQLRQIMHDYVRTLRGVVARDLELTMRLTQDAQVVGAYRCFPSIDRLAWEGGTIPLGLIQSGSRLQVLLEFATGSNLMGERRLAQLELSGIVPATEQRERLVYDYEVLFTQHPEETPVPPAIVNVMNKLNLFRMQEQAWSALEKGQSDEASRRLEAVATRLLDLGENELAQVALLEAGRINEGRQVSGKGQKTIKFGTRKLG